MSSEEEDQLPSDEEEAVASDEEERGSSAEEGGSDDEDDDDEGSDEEGEDSEGSPSARQRRRTPATKKKPFVAPPPRALPQRTTRGARMGANAAVEGDEEFWNQSFFAEEEDDVKYDTESEPEDRFDADFNESEDEVNDDEEAAEAEKDAAAKEKKKKTLKPPGYKKPPLPRPRVKKEEEGEGAAAAGGGGGAGPSTGAGASRKRKGSSVGPDEFSVGRRTVRDSTRQKVEEAEMERKMAEKHKPRRSAPRSSNYKPLTQAEMLAEAAKTEIENRKSLELLVLIEEEARKKANVVKRRYAGPMVRWKSRRVGDTEVSTLEVRNMAMPDELRQRMAPPPAPRHACIITGQPARYRDPGTGLPYASLAAYQELKRRKEAGLLGVQQQFVGAAGGQFAAAAVGQQQQWGGAAGAAGAAGELSAQQYSTQQQQGGAQPAPQQLLQQQFAQVQPGQVVYQPELLMQQQQHHHQQGQGQGQLLMGTSGELQLPGLYPFQQQQQQQQQAALAFGLPPATGGIT